MYADRDGRADAQTDRKTDMINHQKPAYENGKLRTFYTAGLLLDIKKNVSVSCRMVNNATFFSKILLSISAIFADTKPYFKIIQFLSYLQACHNFLSKSLRFLKM